jgi:hypothetical protein
MNTYESELLPNEGGPACGTVGCFAGRVSILARTEDWPIWKSCLHPRLHAQQILGDSLDYSTAGSNGHHVFNAGAGDACGTTNPGTKKHAAAVIARINRFMKKNAVALKAKRIR